MSEHTYTVYIHISPSNKVYVGITHLKPENRWRNGLGYTSKHFVSAIRKYGWNNFKHEIIAENLEKSQAEQIEVALIAYYNSTNPKYGYNCSIGGEKSAIGCRYNRGHFSESHKQALRESWKKRKQKGLGEPWNKGKSLKETGMIDNFIKAGIQNSKNQRRAVYQINLKTHEIIAKYDSILDAARSLGKSYGSSICDTLAGNRKSAFGYGWKYVEDKEMELTKLQ